MWYSILSKVLLCPNHSKYFSLFLLIRRNIHAKHSDCIRKYNLCRASDRRLAKFENLFPIPRGVSYNAYVILDEKTALLDTADASVGAQFLENVAAALDGRKLDYLIVDHMEPDHATMIEAVLVRWPDLRLVVNAKTLPMLKMYFPTDSAAFDDALVVKEGDTLDLGKHKLTFVMAPMVHWPEVMMTFDTTTGTLFSADAFGTFGAWRVPCSLMR